MLREIAALIPALSASASATSADATMGHGEDPCRRVAPAELEHVQPKPPALVALFQAASEKQRNSFSRG